MQKKFNTLTVSKKRKFLVNNLLRDEYFKYLFNDIKLNCICQLHPKSSREELIKVKNDLYLQKYTKLLSQYRHYVIDLHTEPNNKYFYECVIKYKNKILNFPIELIYNVYDSNGFTYTDLLLDITEETKKIITNKEFSLI